MQGLSAYGSWMLCIIAALRDLGISPGSRSLNNTTRHMAQILNMQSYSYNNNLTAAQRTATQLLKSYFTAAGAEHPCFISVPTFAYSPTVHTSEVGVVVQLFYYALPSSAGTKSGKLTSNKYGTSANQVNAATSGNTAYTEKLSSSALKTLGTALSRVFSVAGLHSSTGKLNTNTPNGQSVPVELRIVRLHQPYLNSAILAQYLAVNASKYGFARLRQSLLSAIPLGNSMYAGQVLNNTRAQLAGQEVGAVAGQVSGLDVTSTIIGIKVQLSGLLTTQRNAPRKTVSTVSVGTFHGGDGRHTAVDYASSTSKSTLGAYTVKV